MGTEEDDDDHGTWIPTAQEHWYRVWSMRYIKTAHTRKLINGDAYDILVQAVLHDDTPPPVVFIRIIETHGLQKGLKFTLEFIK